VEGPFVRSGLRRIPSAEQGYPADGAAQKESILFN
jgi:hypothetical protein